MKLDPPPRSVEFQFSNNDIHLVADAMRDQDAYNKLYSALGYLTTWASDLYPQVKVRIVSHESPEILATYYDEKGNRKYVMGAIWHGHHFGFHS